MNDERDRRRTPIAKPSDERTTDQSTPESGGLHGDLAGFKHGPGPELARERDVDDVLNRNAEKRYDTPRRYEEDGADDAHRDPALPTNDSTLNTKI